ncbi:MAG TPA: thermonuclease family protein [Solidesulfovibrio magneticus]|nr:thermonuclease family protein [Solidesulfovibrio magneticus]
MRPSRAACLLFALCWLLSGPVIAAGPDFGQARAVVVRVCDGDTVVVDIPEYPPVIGKAIRVRLAGVNAPERRDPDPAVRRAAEEARQAMAALLPPGTAVTLARIRRDKYFRLNAMVLVAGRDAAALAGLTPDCSVAGVTAR